MPRRIRMRVTRSVLLVTLGGVALAGCGTEVGDGTTTPSADQSPSGSSTPSPTSTPTGTPVPTPDTTADGVVLLDDRLSAGRAPGVAYVQAGGTVHLPDGTVREAAHDYNGFAVTGDLLVGGWYDNEDGNDYVDVETGGELTTTRMGQGIAQSASGRTIAWNTPDGTIETAWDGGQVEIGKAQRGSTVTAVTGDGTCFEAESPSGGCAVYYAPRTGPARLTSSHGIDDIVGSRTLHVSDVAPNGDLASQTSVSDEGSCSGVQRAGRDKLRWETCDYSLFGFSPDGGHLLAGPAYLDGLGFADIQILDAATGEETASFRVPEGYIAGWTWESPDSALLVTYRDSWQMVRITTSGAAETALIWDGEDRDELERPWTLAMRPS